MKILVLSDTHGIVIDSIIKQIKIVNNIEMLVHCGDNYRDADKYAELLNIKEVYKVPGNCDYNARHKESVIIKEIEGKSVLITHGHLYLVKRDLFKLKEYAIKSNVDIVLFGHTHKSHDEIDDNILYFNPGSTTLPMDGKSSFGIINISNKDIKSRIISITN